MKLINFMALPIVLLTIPACSTLPIKTDIREGYFKLETQILEDRSQSKYINIACFHKKPVDERWLPAKQFKAGSHNLWIKSTAHSHRNIIPRIDDAAFVNIKVDLEANKSYRLNQRINGDKVEVWLEDSDNGLVVSNVEIAEFKQSKKLKQSELVTQCKTSTI